MSEVKERFLEHLNKMEYYMQACGQLSWDMYTQTPKKGYDYKVDAITYFSTEAFRLSTSDEVAELYEKMSQPEEYDALSDALKLTVKRGKKEFERSKRIPATFYEEMVKETNIAQKVWEEAKEKSDYDLFCPHLQKLIDMTKQYAKYIEPEKEIYDTLVDQYEEGMDSATIDRLFSDMKEALVPLLKKIMEKPEPDSSIFDGEYDIYKQKELSEFLLKYIGFDMDAGVMAESAHPFTSGFGPRDVRVTNHYHKNDAIDPMFSIIHEGGHAIFEQGVALEYEKTAAASIPFLGLHESQSRFYENILGRNIHFWESIYDKVGEYLPKFKEVELKDFFREINHVKPSFIRTQADELTYNFHIILRYEIEKAIFREGVEAKDLPKLWNDLMEELLGVRPTNDAEGILQDMHWGGGSFGYFPTYLLGTIYDGMLKDAFEAEMGSIDTMLAEGRILEITAWLKDKIHRYGSMRTSLETIKEVCGKEVSAEPIIRHFTEKYTKIYEL